MVRGVEKGLVGMHANEVFCASCKFYTKSVRRRGWFKPNDRDTTGVEGTTTDDDLDVGVSVSHDGGGGWRVKSD